MIKIKISIKDLQNLLDEQKRVTSEHITRNLSVYSWFGTSGVIVDDAKKELRKECVNAGYPLDFDVLKKYLSDDTK